VHLMAAEVIKALKNLELARQQFNMADKDHIDAACSCSTVLGWRCLSAPKGGGRLPLIEDIERGLVACKVHDEDVRWMAEIVQREIRKASRERTDKIVADMYRKLKKEGKI